MYSPDGALYYLKYLKHNRNKSKQVFYPGQGGRKVEELLHFHPLPNFF